VTNVLTISEESRKIAERVDPQRAGAVAVSPQRGNLSFQDMGQVMEFAKLMAISDVAVPKHLRNNPGACLAVTIQALDWQLHPFQVANKSYSVNDRLAFESQLVQAVILARAPIKGRFAVEYSGTGPSRVCKITAALKDGGAVDYTSPPFNAIKVKNSPLWVADPDQQLFYYSARALCRRHFPDVLLGIYTPDELPAGEPRDVTPKASLADRFATAPAAAAPGFNVHHVDAETGEITEPAVTQAAVEEERPREPAQEEASSEAGEKVGPSTPAPAAPAKDAPVEDWIAFAEAVLKDATADTVEDLWNDHVTEPLDAADLMPPDHVKVVEVFNRREAELAP